MKNYKLPNAQDFYFQVANNKIDLTEVKDLISEEIGTAEGTPLEELEATAKTQVTAKASDDYLLLTSRLQISIINLPKCCSPIMGDNVFGFVTIGEGIKIHRSKLSECCPTYW